MVRRVGGERPTRVAGIATFGMRRAGGVHAVFGCHGSSTMRGGCRSQSMTSTLSRRKPGSNVWRQRRAKRVRCTPGLGCSGAATGQGFVLRYGGDEMDSPREGHEVVGCVRASDEGRDDRGIVKAPRKETMPGTH